MSRWKVLALLVITAGRAQGALSPDPAGQADSAAGLSRAVAALAEKSERPAQAYAGIAEETLQFGRRPDAVERLNAPSKESPDPQEPWRNMVGDALAGVDEGERLDPRAADWPRLREELKKLQPPPPPPSQDKKSSKKDSKDKKKQSQKGDKKEPQKGEGEKSDEKCENGGEGESQSPPSSGQGKKGEKKGKSGDESGNEGEEGTDGDGEQGKEQRESKGKGKDPNEVKNFSNSKEGEGKMKERSREEDLAAVQDESAGFGGLGEEKKPDGKKEEGKGMAQGGKSGDKKEKEAPAGMRVVGGGSGKKKQEESGDAYTVEANARLEQVRQSDSPALLQQRLQPKDQRPSPSSNAKPW